MRILILVMAFAFLVSVLYPRFLREVWWTLTTPAKERETAKGYPLSSAAYDYYYKTGRLEEWRKMEREDFYKNAIEVTYPDGRKELVDGAFAGGVVCKSAGNCVNIPSKVAESETKEE